MKSMSFMWKRLELGFILVYALGFYLLIIHRSTRIANEYSHRLRGIRPGWIPDRLIDVSDAQWRNFRGNVPILALVFGSFTIISNALRQIFSLDGSGMSIIWSMLSLIYLAYLHGACILYILFFATMNFFLVKGFARSRLFFYVLWIFNVGILLLNRVYEGYSFSLFGQSLSFLDEYRGTFRWHISFNLVILRMISFGCDYHSSLQHSHFDEKVSCVPNGKFTFSIYLCYLIYAPLYIAGPIVGFNAFALQLYNPQKTYSLGQLSLYGVRWILLLILMEVMTHFCYYNAFAVSGLWTQLSPFEIFIIGYGVVNFMWLKFSLIWRFFRFWSLAGGIDTPENMPKCINNCYDLEGFWKSWHSSFNKWIVRYMYIPLGGSQKKLLNVWVIFTFVALWHDLEWKLLSWAWLTCLFFMPEIAIKSSLNVFQARSLVSTFVIRELRAICGAITITCLMVANLVGYVIGPSGARLWISRLIQKDGLPVLFCAFITFYSGTKLMFHIEDARPTNRKR